MPSAVAVLAKNTLFRNLIQRNGGYRPYACTGAGNGGGTTLVCATLSGRIDMVGKYFLLTSGTNSGQYRRCLSFSLSTAIFPDAFGAQIASGVTFEIYTYDPALLTTAINVAIADYPSLYRLVNSHIIPNNLRLTGQGDDMYAMPRNMQRVFAVTYLGPMLVGDMFNRGDSALTPDNSWVNQTGIGGLSSEQLYFVTDANADIVMRPELAKDVVIQTRWSGTLNSASTYRAPALIFRRREDYTGAIDTSVVDYLAVRLLNGVVDLRKVDAGSESSLTTTTQTTADGTMYQVRVQAIGPNIKVWVDDVQLIDYTLTGLNLKYTQYQRSGLRLDKGSSPATAARIDDYYLFNAGHGAPWTDYEATGDTTVIKLPATYAQRPNGILLIEGAAPLTTVAEDTTQQTIASYSTATVEMVQNEQGYERFLTRAEAAYHSLLATYVDFETGDLIPGSATHLMLAARLEAKADKLPSMTRPRVRPKGGQH